MKTSAYTPFEVGAKDRIVGFFVIGAVLLFLIGFLIPFVQRLQADEGLGFHTILDQTYGIARDAQVSLRGVNIGRVTKVGITSDGMVRVDISLSPDYQHYYVVGSRLEVDTNIGVNSILTGSGLILVPDTNNNELMKSGDFIQTAPPKGIATLLEDLDLAALTRQVTSIVANVEGITAGLNQNQATLYRSLDNLETLTTALAQVSRSLPDMVLAVDQSLASLQQSMVNVDALVRHSDQGLQDTLQNTVMLTRQATTTLAEAEQLFKAASPALKQLPTVLVTTDIALQSITELTDQLSRSWLLGGGESATPTPRPVGPAPHPHDDGLYEPKQN